VDQMYNPNWEVELVKSLLYEGWMDDEFARTTDLLLCTQPLPVCNFLRSIDPDIPMIIYQAFPLAGTVPHHFKIFMLMHMQALHQTRNTVFIAYNRFLQRQHELQVGIAPICIRPHSLYATHAGTYDPDRADPKIFMGRMAGWAKNSARTFMNLLESFAIEGKMSARFVCLGMRRERSRYIEGLEQPFNYPSLKKYRAAIYFPWDLGMLLWSELYALNVPLLFPHWKYQTSIIWQMLRTTNFGWWQARDINEGKAPYEGSSDTPWPWWNQNSTIADIKRWYDLSDFERWPHVTYFTSLPDLIEKIEKMDFESTSEKMRVYNDETFRRSVTFYQGVISAVLNGTPIPTFLRSNC